jgi:hypothetical protein
VPVTALRIVVVLTVFVFAAMLALNDLAMVEGDEGEVPLQLRRMNSYSG